MINLFEVFDHASRELYMSLKHAGNNHPTVVIEDDGFLPEDCITPYLHFSRFQPAPHDKAKFFNEIKRPQYWEVEGNNERAEINDKGVKRANIIYKENYKLRIVQKVEWLSGNGTVRFIDHYNQYGFKYAQTVNNVDGSPIFKTFFDQQERVVIYENYITSDVVLTIEGQEQVFSNKNEFIRYFIEQLDIDTSKIIFNSLGKPLLSIYNIDKKIDAYLFWQEHMGTEIPGNMSTILSAGGPIDFKVVVPDKTEYEKILKHTNKQYHHKIHVSGYIYHYHKQNTHDKNVLTMTNSDQLGNIETTIQACPEYMFHIAAITEMSSKLMDLGRYENVKLYPSADMKTARALYDKANIYLDINYGGEIVNAVRSAFDYELLIIGYHETAHNKQYTAPQLLFNTTDADLVHKYIQMSVNDKQQLLLLQKQHAHAVSVEEFNHALNL